MLFVDQISMNNTPDTLQTFPAVKPNPNVIFRRLGEEVVLFNLETDHFYELNWTAARFWELLHAGRDSTEACEQMLEEFAVDSDQLVKEAKAFLVQLRREDLVAVDE